MCAELPIETLMRTVVRRGLCTRCGTCVGACPADNLFMDDPLGACLPSPRDRCTGCGLCLAACPGATVDFAPLERALFGEGVSEPFLGVARRAYVVHAADAATRRAGSSGGVVTALLLHLLDRREIAGALVFAPVEGEPWHGWGGIARTRAEVLAAAQSRYHLSPLNTALRDIPAGAGTYAYVGLPCQVHGLRKLQSEVGVRRDLGLSPVIGLYCGNNLYYAATRAMLKKLGIRRPEELVSLRYREGVWPGSFWARTSDGRERAISKLDFNQAIPFYVNRRCLFCIDLTNELDDLSVGDGWAKEGGEQEGWSVAIARTERGDDLLRGAVAAGTLVAEEIGLADARRMHSHAFDLKKIGAPLRLRLWRACGVPVPRYDRSSPRVGAARRLFEIVVSLQFALASTRAGRALFGAIPPRLLGRIFRALRKGWMRSTSRR